MLALRATPAQAPALSLWSMLALALTLAAIAFGAALNVEPRKASGEHA